MIQGLITALVMVMALHPHALSAPLEGDSATRTPNSAASSKGSDSGKSASSVRSSNAGKNTRSIKSSDAGKSSELKELHGLWKFTEVEYKGERRPPFNDELLIHFLFKDDGENYLHWTRVGEKGFCERKSTYSWDGQALTQTITWVNPNNRIDCSKDPDMMLDKKSVTPVEVKDGELWVELGLGDDPLFYIWKRSDKPWPGELNP